MSPRVDVSMSADQVRAFLDAPRTAVLCTNGKDGFPHSVAMWFAPVIEGAGGELRMWAYRKSQKVINLERDPRCAVMIEEGLAYNELKGVLVRGEARVLEDPDEIFDIGRRLYEIYTLPATGVPSELAEEELRRQAGKRKGIVLPMERVASWDHRKL